MSFESDLEAGPDFAWAWITSIDSVSKEMFPFFRMTAPAGMRNIASIAFMPGVPMFRSWILLAGVLPVDFSDLTLVSVTSGVGFVERSRMGSMRSWRHARTITRVGRGCRVTDVLTFEPRLGGRFAVMLIRALFNHRHRRLKAFLGKHGVSSAEWSAD